MRPKHDKEHFQQSNSHANIINIVLFFIQVYDCPIDLRTKRNPTYLCGIMEYYIKIFLIIINKQNTEVVGS